jgi:1-phosphofructokinase/tagatose 6-phosphate kinase
MNDAFLSICMNPTFQKTLCFKTVAADRVNRASLHRIDVSGKGINVTRVLTQLGKRAAHLTHLGGPLRDYFLSLCRSDGLDVRWVESGSAIRFCYTCIAGGGAAGRSVTELVEEGESVSPGTEERLLEKYRETLSLAGTVIFSGTKAKGYSDTLVPEMVRLAAERGKRVILDVRGNDLLRSLEYNPQVIKPNLYEFADTFAPELVKKYGELSGNEEGVKETVREIAGELCAKYKTSIILSRGGEAVWYFCGDASGECPVKKEIPVNTIGSGDAFTAGFAAALGEGRSFPEAVAEGIRCGGLNARFLRPGVIQESISE